jgi:hypothetical protein
VVQVVLRKPYCLRNMAILLPTCVHRVDRRSNQHSRVAAVRINHVLHLWPQKALPY